MKLFQIHARHCLALLLILFATHSGAVVPTAPSLEASAWLLMDANSGAIITERNADMRVPPASLTKMMTAYVADYEISQGNLSRDADVFISVKAWQTGGSKMFVREGTTVKAGDLLRGIIIQSGNDASIALAEHIAGSEEAFAEMMNFHAKRLGMVNTHFVNATGLPHENHYSTARDLAILGQAKIRDFPEDYQLYSERYFTWSDIQQPNRNMLLWRDESVDGIKTGHTEEAGYCLVASAKRDGMRLISVVMGTNSELARARESQTLLNYGFRFFETHTVYEQGSVLGTAPVWFGRKDSVAIGPASDVVITLPRNARDRITAEMQLNDDIRAPIAEGDSLGTIQIKLDGEVIHAMPATALHEVEEANFFKRLWHHLKRFLANLLG